MPLVYPPAIEGSVKSYTWYQLVLKVIADCTTEKNAVDGFFELAAANAFRAAVKFRFFGKDEFL